MQDSAANTGRASAAVSEVQRIVAEVWTDVLQREQIAVSDNFFDLGGDSLKALEVISRVQAELNVELPLITFFEDPTIANLASVIEELREVRSTSCAPGTAPRTSAPLSFAQLQYWLLQQSDPIGNLYTNARVLRIRGKFQPDILQASLDELCRRHQVLACRITPGIDEPLAVFDPDPKVSLELQDLTTLPPHSREQIALAAAREEWHRPLNLTTDLPIRARLLRLAQEDHLLVIVMHHVVSDGYTGGIFFEELAAIYSGLLAGSPAVLPDLALQYSDYAISERSQMQGKRLEKEIEFWRSNLGVAPRRLWLPTDKPRPALPGHTGATCSVTVSPETLEELKSLAQSGGSTFYTVLLGGLRIVLHRWTGERDIVIGTVASNRSRAGTDRLVGCFVNFLPFRNQVATDESALEFLNREKQVVRDVFAHQDCPFLKIVTATNSVGITEASPVYNVALLLQNFPAMKFEGESFAAEFIELESETALLDLRFVVNEHPSGLQIDCEFRTELFHRKSIRSLLEGFRGVLQELARDGTRRVSDFSIPAELVEQREAARRREHPWTIAVTSSFTAGPIEPPLAFWMREFGVASQFKFAPYNQVFQQLLDPESIVSRNRDGFNIVLLRLTDWLRFEGSPADAVRKETIAHNIGELIAALKSHPPLVPTFLCMCPGERHYQTAEWPDFLRGKEQEITSGARSIPNLHVITSKQIFDLYPVEKYADEYADKVGHVPYTPDFFAALSTVLARQIFALRTEPRKVIVLDVDSWMKITPGDAPDSGIQASRCTLAEFLVNQFESQGALVCLCGCSTGEEVDAFFAHYPDLPLRPEHIIARSLGVQFLSTGLRQLGEELQLELDTFVLISGDPGRCNEVQRQRPEVLALCLPQDSRKTRGFIQNLWVFDARPESVSDQCFAVDDRLLSRIASELTDSQRICRAIDAANVHVRESGTALVAPRTPFEEMVAEIWAQILKLDRISIHDNFFALGGHSLLATQAIARVRRTLGAELPLRVMFEAPTVAQFAMKVEAALTPGKQKQLPCITPRSTGDTAPLSFAQQRLWFLDQLDAGNPLYNMTQMMHLRGNLDVPALRGAINKMVERHEALRTTFAMLGNEPAQVIARELQVPVPIIDLSSISPNEREAQVEKLAREEAQDPFDLSSGPVIRARILRVHPQHHVLLLTLHHIVSDRWSLGVAAEEVSAHYRAVLEAESSPLPGLAIQYADFAVWQRQILQGEFLNEQLQYWKKQLAGAPQLLQFPTDYARPAQMSMRGAIESLILPRSLVEKLTAFSQQEGATLFMTLLAAFQVLLKRYSGQDDIVVGSPIAGRNFTELEPLIGFFVNTLALRGNLSDDLSFRELLARTKETCLQAYAYQDIPFERLVEELQPERSLRHNPIFQVLFALQNAPMQSLQLPGLELERSAVHPGTSILDMSWFAIEVPEGLLLRVEYSTDLFEKATIAHALQHFAALLEAGADTPDAGITELSLLTAAGRQQNLAVCNATDAEYPRDICMYQLFEQQVQRSPDAIAVRFGSQRLTYRELNCRSNQLARQLREMAVERETLVGIYVERSPDMLTALLAVQKAGGAYIPLDPAYPHERIAFILEDAHVAVLITHRSLLPSVPPSAARVVCLDDWGAISRQGEEDLAPTASPESLAYVLYTSGSTGKPKGVQIEHRSLVNFLASVEREPGLGETDRLLAVTTLSFDIAGLELYLPLVAGAEIVLASREDAADGERLRRLLEESAPTVMQATPATWRMLLDCGWHGSPALKALCGGEALTADLAERLLGCCAELWNMYGPTETTIWSSLYRVSEPFNGTAPIGRPIANTSMYVLDANRQPVPKGVAGELYIGGLGVARGYLNRPELTGERLLPDPFSQKPGARLYRTGDLARVRNDGAIDYLGRTDFQIKLRGFRVELGEIESALAKHPAVRQVVVAAREDSPGDKRLAAYVVLEAGQSFSLADAREYLKRSLPDYMIPSALVPMETLPLTPNGKLDRKRLPVPDYRGLEPVRGGRQARTPTEEILSSIWGELLHQDRIGVEENFFELGGHSLLATQVISRIRQAFHIQVPLRTLFESPTIAGLAMCLEQMRWRQSAPTLPPLQNATRAGRLPQSFAQQRLWFLDQLEPGSPVYNLAYTVRLKGPLHPDWLEAGLNTIAARHESLRTSFSADAESPIQIIQNSVRVPFRCVDLSSTDNSTRQAEAERLIAEDANRPFDLTEPPLLRATLVRLDAEDHYFLISIHHAISDRWSIGLIWQELIAAYEAALENKPAELPALPLQYADYAIWQRAWLRDQPLREQLSYWKEKLKDAPSVLELPTDRPRPAVESSQGDAAYASVSPELTARLKQISKQHGATLFMILLAGFQVLLSRYSGQQDVIVGTAVANRSHPDLEKVIGYFVNTLPLRTDLSGDPSFSELLAQVKETALAAYAHQDLPFEKLVEELNPERSLSHSPLIQVFFVLQNAPTELLASTALRMEHTPSGLKTVKGDMFLSMEETASGLQARLEYSTALFDHSTIVRLLGHYKVLLEAVAENSATKISRLPLLTQEERQQILVDWNQTAAEFPRDLCLHELFEAAAEANPQNIACLQPGNGTAEDREITYLELNARANQLARALRTRGARAGTRVGVQLERSIDLMVGLLAIIKSGAAYVPLDPAYPSERIRMTLEDAQVPLLVTQESLVTGMPAHEAELLCIDRDWPMIARESGDNLGKTATPEDLVYVIFTSGSTGRPKGVQIPHRSVVNLLAFMARELSMGPGDVFPALASVAFDMCIPELYLALIRGGRVVIAHKDLAADGEALAQLLQRTGATVVHATPTTWRLLLDAGFSGQGLKRVIGAEPLPRELWERLLDKDPSLYNFYGPTETTVWSTCHHFRSVKDSIVVGKPIANTQVYILDSQRQPVPVGIYGEIYIGGEGVGKGYLSRPELTSERFVADPFSRNAQAKMYRTGDIARFLSDGRIEFQGRADHQVKIRGYRVELGEIEAVIARYPAIAQSVVAVREDVAADKRLVGYVVPKFSEQWDAGELRDFLKERLPDYMVPSAWVELEKIPLSPNGKVDRKHLPAPDYGALRAQADSDGPHTVEEELVAGIWSEVLNVERVGRRDDFFELGGHSLLAAQVISRLRQSFKIQMPVRSVFESPTVAGLAQRVISEVRKGQGLIAPPLYRTARNRPLPLSFAQQRLWFLDQLEPGNPLYNVAYITRIKGPLNFQALEKSLNEIVARHEALRTTFRSNDDQPVQVIATELQITIKTLDVSDITTAAARESHAQKRATEEMQQPFDLALGPLMRALVLTIGPDDHALVLTTHHIISDRWSLGVLSQELATLYEAHLKNQTTKLPELKIQYGDYAIWEREALSQEVLNRQLSYWRKQLEGAPAVLALPTDHPRKTRSGFLGAQHRQAIAPGLVRDLRSFSRSQRGTFFMTLLAAFQLLLAYLTGQDDIVVGTDLANRNQLETEKLIGFFVNLLPMRARLSNDATFVEFFQQVREASLGAFTHQDIPFDKLVEELQPERNLSHNPLVQVLFVMQNTPQVETEFAGLKLEPLGVSSSSRFDLVMFINDPEHAPWIMWSYNPELFDATTVARIANLYQATLEKLSADSQIKVGTLLGWLGEVERQQRAAEQKDFQAASAQKLKKFKRRAITRP